jgi:DNA-binding transcriptional MocR family regulator
VKSSQEELGRQFELSSRLAVRLSQVSAAMQQTKELRKQMDARKKEARGNAELQQALEALEKKIEVAVEPDSDDDFMLFGLGMPSKEHEPLPKVAAALTALLIIVESADTAPTADAAMSSEKWDVSAQETLARWTTLKKEELASANALLQKAKLKLLTVDEPPTAH